MDTSEQIVTFQELFEQSYHKDILTNARKGNHFLNVDFTDLSKYSPELAELLLENPEETLRAAEIATEHFDLGETKSFVVRFHNLPKSQQVDIRNIRSSHLGKFIQVRGIIRQKSDVRPQVTTAKFECPSCGNIINILQIEQKFREPTKCNACGRKGRFRLLSKELVDAQRITLEEAPDELEDSPEPKKISIFLKNDLVSPIGEKKTNPGSKIVITGLLKEVPIILSQGGQSTRFDLMIETNHVTPVEEEYEVIKISPEREEEILELSKDPKLYEKLIESIAPGIYGMERVKEALVLQIFGGIRKVRADGVITRGDTHILLIGDPGSGKSAMIKRMQRVAPKSRMVSGKGATGTGLTATVVKDEFLRGWALEAGLLVLANKGMALIDEMDKMSAEDTSAMHEALEQQTVTVAKANINATLKCETTVLAAANPKFGRFDQYEILFKQIDLPVTLINRFDLIFPIKDLPDKTKDGKLAEFVLEQHKTGTIAEAPISTELFRDFVAYAKQHCTPTLTKAATEEIKKYYITMRGSGGEEGKITSVPITARQLEALVRLAESAARTRLSDKVTKADAKTAIDILQYCLELIGLDPETGKIDIDRIMTGTTTSQREKFIAIKKIISDLEEIVGKNIPVEDIIQEAKEQGYDEDTVEEILKELSRKGEIFKPTKDKVSRL